MLFYLTFSWTTLILLSIFHFQLGKVVLKLHSNQTTKTKNRRKYEPKQEIEKEKEKC